MSFDNDLYKIRTIKYILLMLILAYLYVKAKI